MDVRPFSRLSGFRPRFRSVGVQNSAHPSGGRHSAAGSRYTGATTQTVGTTDRAESFGRVVGGGPGGRERGPADRGVADFATRAQDFWGTFFDEAGNVEGDIYKIGCGW